VCVCFFFKKKSPAGGRGPVFCRASLLAFSHQIRVARTPVLRQGVFDLQAPRQGSRLVKFPARHAHCLIFNCRTCLASDQLRDLHHDILHKRDCTMSRILDASATVESRFETAISMTRIANEIFWYLPSVAAGGTPTPTLFNRDVRALHATVPHLDPLSRSIKTGVFTVPSGLMPGLTELPIWKEWSSGGRKRILKETRDALQLPGVAVLEVRATDYQLYWHAVLEVQATRYFFTFFWWSESYLITCIPARLLS
jgi:hypothetical protein